MDYGAVMFPTEYSIAPDELARALEERGFESVWFPEHTHIPASRKSPWPGGGELPRDYWSAYDPFIALMAAAAATKRLKLGTGICLVIERDPIVTAKEVATLDRLSGGRVLFGIGGGWNAEEMAHHGTAWKSRWRVLRERVLAMKKIWTEREASYQGEFVRFEKIWADPKPLQKPHPPIIIGGDGETHLRPRRRVRRRLDADPAPAHQPGGEDPRAARAVEDGGPRSEVGAGVHLLRAAQAGGARRARGGRGAARHLRPARRRPATRCCRSSTPTRR